MKHLSSELIVLASGKGSDLKTFSKSPLRGVESLYLECRQLWSESHGNSKMTRHMLQVVVELQQVYIGNDVRILFLTDQHLTGLSSNFFIFFYFTLHVKSIFRSIITIFPITFCPRSALPQLQALLGMIGLNFTFNRNFTSFRFQVSLLESCGSL